MKTLKDFTPEIQNKIPSYINNALQGVFDGGRYNNFNLNNAVEAVNYNYEICGFKKPLVLVAENPYESQLLFNFVWELLSPNSQLRSQLDSQLNSQLDSQIDIQLYSQLRSQIDSQLDSQLRSQLYRQLDNQLYSQLDRQLDSQLRSQLYRQIDSQLYSQLDNQLRNQLYSQLRSQLDNQLRSQLDRQIDSQLNKQLDSQLNSQLYSQLDRQLRSQIYSQLDSQIDIQLYDQLRSQLYSQLDNQLRNQLYSQIDSQLDRQLDRQIDSQLRSQLYKYNNQYLFTLNIYSDCYYNWYEFIRKEFNIKIDEELNNKFQKIFKLQRESGVYSAIFSESLCVVSKYPQRVVRNNNFELNNINGEAVKWGYTNELTKLECYYVNGFNITKELFQKVVEQRLTIDEFFKESNEETKSSILALMEQKFGREYVVDFFKSDLEEVDTYIDKKDDKYLEGTTNGMNIGVYTLFKGNINNTEISYVRCYCPSTDRMFYLGVEDTHTNAKDAIASLYRVPLALKNGIEAIYRQGEKFSTFFNNVITKKLEQNEYSKEDLTTYTSLTGDEYFKLLKWEY